jgi:hypothetical protein
VINTKRIIQSAFVVDDIQEAMCRWLKTANIGPFYLMKNCKPDNVLYRGRPSELVMDVAFCQAGPTQIELIQPKTNGANVYRDSVPSGVQAYHHICYVTDDLDAEYTHFANLGAEPATEAIFGAMRYAYWDTRALIGCMTEVMERDAAVEGMFRMIAEASIDWDGRDPIRLIG